MRNKFKFIFVFASFMAFGLRANETFLKENVQRLDWDGIEVVWLKDDRFPTFHLSVYFADGSLSDRQGKEGETNAFFEMIKSGTSRYNQRDIAEIFDFYATGIGHSVVGEYSQYEMSGMMKFLIPSTKMFCQLFSDATFPDEELALFKKRSIAGLQNMIANHGQIAEHLSRQLVFADTPLLYPTVGRISTIDKLSLNEMKEKKKYFNNIVKKRIYLVGPKEVLKVASVLKNDCKWSGEASFQRVNDSAFKITKKNEGVLFFAPVEGANQAQIRLGKILSGDDLKLVPDLMAFTSAFIGSGFNSRLFQELRVKRGYTYGASSAAANQKNYGRVVVSTFSKNETVRATIEVTIATLDNVVKGKISEEQLNLSKKYILGNTLLSLEESSDFLNKLVYMDHLGTPYEELYRFNDRIKSYTTKNVSEMAGKTFRPSTLDIFVFGNPTLEEDLKKLGRKIIKVRYQDYL